MKPAIILFAAISDGLRELAEVSPGALPDVIRAFSSAFGMAVAKADIYTALEAERDKRSYQVFSETIEDFSKRIKDLEKKVKEVK
jgi:hypothetical protein